MIIIDEILISDDVVNKHFICNLNACKGACCVEGDFGAPLENEELEILESIYDDIKPFLDKKGIEAIEKKGHYTYFDEPAEYGTTLLDNGACAYLTTDHQTGMMSCGIEQAYKAGATDFYKPISCHLYPIRIEKNLSVDFEALNYDVWNICSAACTLGKEKDVRIYEFLKEPLIRRYGEDFYNQLDETVKHLNKD